MADEYYNNKIVTTDGDVLMDLTQDTATPETVLEGETFHLRSGAPAVGTYQPSDEIEARLRATVGHSSKNLLEITARATTSYEVTFTPDRINGTILATGQCNPPATNRAQYDYGGGLKPIPDSFRQELILKDDGLIEGTQSAIAFYDDSGTYISGVACDKNTKSKTVTVPSNATKYKVFVRKTASAGDVDVTFKPMLREASIADDTFEPYQEPTDSLIETRTRAYLTSTVGHACKNLLKITADSQTINGVTFTVDKTAGTITVNGQVSSSATMAQLDIVSRRNVDSSLNELILTEPASKTIPNYGFRTAITYYNSSGTYISEQVINSHNPNPVVVSVPSNAYTYKVYVRATTSAGTLNNLVIKPMLREASISDDTFEPYVTPTDEAKQDKPVLLYDAGESSVGVHSVTGLSNLTQYSELHITLFSPLNGDEPDNGITHTIVRPFIFPYNPENQSSFFDCWIMAFIDGAFVFKRVGIYVGATNTKVRISGEIDEQTGEPISIPSNHYIYIKRIVGIP